MGKGSTFPVLPLRLLHVSFPNTPLAHLLVNTTTSPPYSFKRFRLFALTTLVVILMRYLLMTHPAILVPNAMSLTFFSIPESNRLDLPVLLITVQLPSLHFFFQVLTVVLTKEYFGYLIRNFLIAEAVSKSLAYGPTSFLNFAGILTFDIFSGACMYFTSLLQCKQAVQKSLMLAHWLSEYPRFHPYFVISF